MHDILSTLFLQSAQMVNVFLGDIHFIVLQCAAMVGIVSIVVMCRGRVRFRSNLSELIGVGFGVTAFLLFLFMMMEFWVSGGEQDVRRYLKPYLRNDLLFLAAFFGGLSGAAYTLFFVGLARYMFGPLSDLYIAFFDMVLIAFGAVYVRQIFHFHDISRITAWQVAVLLAAKLVIVLFPLLLIVLFGVMPFEQLSGIFHGRILVAFSVSVIVFYSLIFLLRREVIYERLLYYDTHSGLPNRKALQERIQRIFRSEPLLGKGSPAVMLLINVANFKALIQDHGYESVDTLLTVLGQRAEVFCSRQDRNAPRGEVYSFSDHTLAVVIEGADVEQVRASGIALDLYNVLVEERQYKRLPYKAWITIGVVEIDDSARQGMQNPQWFLRGLALVEPMWNEPVQYFDAKIAVQAETEHCIRGQIESWIYSGEVPLWFQPKIDLQSQRCIGAEALLRVPNEVDGGFYSPYTVLSIAEQSHRLDDLEWAILRTVVRRLNLLDAMGQGINLSVNISSVSLQKLGFGEQVCTLLETAGVSGARLTVEVVETYPIVVSDILKENLATMAANRIRIALDDFGVGYSSLDLLSQLRFDELKIDYNMTSRLETSNGHIAVSLAVEGAQRYGAVIVAEGIETAAQYGKLLEMGVQAGQGYLFEKAIPFERLIEFLTEERAAVDGRVCQERLDDASARCVPG